MSSYLKPIDVDDDIVKSSFIVFAEHMLCGITFLLQQVTDCLRHLVVVLLVLQCSRFWGYCLGVGGGVRSFSVITPTPCMAMAQQHYQQQNFMEEPQAKAAAVLPSSSMISTASSTANMFRKVNASLFYDEWHGHPINLLEDLIADVKLKQQEEAEQTGKGHRGIIWLAGDSTLDNKYWVDAGSRPACNFYEDILNPPRMKPDVAYHINNLAMNQRKESSSPSSSSVLPPRWCAINTAVEESTLGVRANGHLLPHDQVIQRYIVAEDVLVVSVGGNDVALRPTMRTIFNMLKMMKWNSLEDIQKGPSAWGMPYFINMFKEQVQSYVKQLVNGGASGGASHWWCGKDGNSLTGTGSFGAALPRLVVVCMVYFLDEKMTGSWADRALGVMEYNERPEKLQEAIRQIYKLALQQIKIEGTTVVTVPFFEYLNGKDTTDYVARVEPSDQGGRKMAKALLTAINNAVSNQDRHESEHVTKTTESKADDDSA